MIESKQELYEYLEMDKKALGIKRKFPRPFIDEIWKYEILMRKLAYLINCKDNFMYKPITLITRLRYEKLGMKLGFSIGINSFGPGLNIAHYGTIVVNGNARIGSNCWIYPGANIGANTGGPKDVPNIGDNVYIGPGAKLFGNINIADNISIGANAVVTKSFTTSGITIAGVPAKIIKDNNPNGKLMMQRINNN